MADKTVTVGPSKTYATIQAAFAAEQADLTDAAYYSGGPGRLIIECYNQNDTTEVNTVGQTWVTSASYYVWIKAMENHGGKYTTSSYRLTPSGSDDGFDFDADHTPEYMRISGIIIDATGTSGNAYGLGGGVGVGWCWMEKVIAIGDSGSNHAITFNAADVDFYLDNCLVYGFTGSGKIGIRWNSLPYGYISNCTVDDCDILVDPYPARALLTNVRLTNAVTSICNSEDIAAASDYNLTDESTTVPSNWGTNSIDGNDTPTLDYVDSDNATLTSRDYHLASASDSGDSAGTDLSAAGISPEDFDDDIDGTTRTKWSIGAHDGVSASGEGGSKATLSTVRPFTAVQRASTW